MSDPARAPVRPTKRCLDDLGVAEGIPDPRVIAVILGAVPGIGKDDWLPEPGGVAGITPSPGQIIWSAIIPPESQARILAHADDLG